LHTTPHTLKAWQPGNNLKKCLVRLSDLRRSQ